MTITIATQVRNRLFKNLYEISFVKNPAELDYQLSVKNYTIKLPALSTADRELVETLNTEGVAITSLEALSIPSAPQMFEAAKNLMLKIPAITCGEKNDYVVHATSTQIMESPEIFLWGLEQRLLNIVENYLGLPVAYHGAYFRRDIANNVEKKSRLWHMDSEDRKLLKIIVYLNDINEDNGPFQYIPQSLTPEVTHALRYKHGYIRDKTMSRAISPSNYRSCTGSAGTVVFAGTASVFHRGKKPVASDRFAIFYDYTSRQPKFPFYCKSSLPEEDLVLLSKKFSEQQKQYVFWRE
ncbi:2OG-Fe(II) oxygenase [Scytonema sp. UIC 10036]|uniref:phytanoyl-CoA dioxygenase family protein n=1 Tax=Scytonema sp. UIC 10036 TaxID=2304196 RepID=UPI0012DAA1BC|nr:phytanoyl-CoA dioxygenase family protein [Scytonema sp. UIC 10036]MUH01097.1 2OG-Fe(II) oxygenase [Scytonema sp. UIC 10036]